MPRWESRCAISAPAVAPPMIATQCLDAEFIIRQYLHLRRVATTRIWNSLGVRGEKFSSTALPMRYPEPGGPLAQWLEHPAHNWIVLGSNPRGPTNPLNPRSLFARFGAGTLSPASPCRRTQSLAARCMVVNCGIAASARCSESRIATPPVVLPPLAFRGLEASPEWST